jgi:hypothetical protein
MISRKNFLELGAMARAGPAPPLGTLSNHLLPPNTPFEGCLSPGLPVRLLLKSRGVGRGCVPRRAEKRSERGKWRGHGMRDRRDP